MRKFTMITTGMILIIIGTNTLTYNSWEEVIGMFILYFLASNLFYKAD